MVWKFALGFVVFLVLGASALAIYGARLEPPTRGVEQVLPDNRFPR
jgi:uncharacterized membrane protein